MGTRPIHMLPVYVGLGLGFIFDSMGLMGFAAGMGVVLVIGNVRCRAPHYRYRVRDAGPREDEVSE